MSKAMVKGFQGHAVSCDPIVSEAGTVLSAPAQHVSPQVLLCPRVGVEGLEPCVFLGSSVGLSPPLCPACPVPSCAHLSQLCPEQ